jgi:hypothetical protein
MADHGHPPAGAYERKDVSIRALIRFGVCLVVGTSIVALAMVWLFAILQRREPPPPPSAVAEPWQPIPGPRLQVSPYSDYEVLRARDQRILDSYGWVDKNAGIVRIPIEHAMDLVAQRSGAEKRR